MKLFVAGLCHALGCMYAGSEPLLAFRLTGVFE